MREERRKRVSGRGNRSRVPLVSRLFLKSGREESPVSERGATRSRGRGRLLATTRPLAPRLGPPLLASCRPTTVSVCFRALVCTSSAATVALPPLLLYLLRPIRTYIRTLVLAFSLSLALSLRLFFFLSLARFISFSFSLSLASSLSLSLALSLSRFVSFSLLLARFLASSIFLSFFLARSLASSLSLSRSFSRFISFFFSLSVVLARSGAVVSRGDHLATVWDRKVGACAGPPPLARRVIREEEFYYGGGLYRDTRDPR